jgi:phosphatidate cytidylyltransferase
MTTPTPRPPAARRNLAAPAPRPAPERKSPAVPAPGQGLDGRNLGTRVATSVVFGVFFLALLWFGDAPWAKTTFAALLGGALWMATRELAAMGRKLGHNPSVLAGVLVGAGILLHFYLGGLGHPWDDRLPLWLVLVLGGLVVHLGSLLFQRDVERSLTSQALTLMGALYLGLGLGCMVRLFMLKGSTLPNTGSRFILTLFIVTWFGDSAAYFVGSLLGRHKLAPRVSPKKTWEGAAGGLLGNLAGAALMKFAHVLPEWGALDLVAVAILLGLVGQLGDLVESAWKRSAGIKDSGSSIPGHGGMLDRLDSLVFAAPVLLAYLHLVMGIEN